MWLLGQKELGVLVNLSEIKGIYKDYNTMHEVWELRVLFGDRADCHSSIIVGIYPTEENINKAFQSICNSLSREQYIFRTLEVDANE